MSPLTPSQLQQSPHITLQLTSNFSQASSDTTTIQTITYLIINDGGQLKLLRTDIAIAYWITPMMLKKLTEF
jgi:hypothetical protein